MKHVVKAASALALSGVLTLGAMPTAVAQAPAAPSAAKLNVTGECSSQFQASINQYNSATTDAERQTAMAQVQADLEASKLTHPGCGFEAEAAVSTTSEATPTESVTSETPAVETPAAGEDAALPGSLAISGECPSQLQVTINQYNAAKDDAERKEAYAQAAQIVEDAKLTHPDCKVVVQKADKNNKYLPGAILLGVGALGALALGAGGSSQGSSQAGNGAEPGAAKPEAAKTGTAEAAKPGAGNPGAAAPQKGIDPKGAPAKGTEAKAAEAKAARGAMAQTGNNAVAMTLAALVALAIAGAGVFVARRNRA
ncbi:LPXTG cell wall anchor domain-containing protein [Corynebacterium epidermidicanis]|uniref:Gram-positive cocci surface proteins LPxTG domain-containing protein n=1 Tax=Corynebacterium epidermidicanis TaxID=1050174 RepID=A0A0G3GVP9_9CORY|nr:LPXTG cell wall anchor domain-containing protein [Corynebacterium epidermidicanis]AKK02942.1 hypothetical protein CEPID_05365 [Corynebacterium epidermidicanis]